MRLREDLRIPRATISSKFDTIRVHDNDTRTSRKAESPVLCNTHGTWHRPQPRRPVMCATADVDRSGRSQKKYSNIVKGAHIATDTPKRRKPRRPDASCGTETMHTVLFRKQARVRRQTTMRHARKGTPKRHEMGSTDMARVMCHALRCVHTRGLHFSSFQLRSMLPIFHPARGTDASTAEWCSQHATREETSHQDVNPAGKGYHRTNATGKA